jgi:hypothetical protein
MNTITVLTNTRACMRSTYTDIGRYCYSSSKHCYTIAVPLLLLLLLLCSIATAAAAVTAAADSA